MAWRLIASFLAVIITGVIAIHQDGMAEERPVAGYVEKVLLSPGKVQAYALLETGAAGSIVYTSIIDEFERENRPWVRYSIETQFGQRTTFENPVIKSRLINASDEKPERLITIRLRLCFGESILEGDFDLVESKNFAQQVILGRDILSDRVFIDASASYLLEPNCS